MDPILEARLNRIAQAIARLERKTDFILDQLKVDFVDDEEGNIPAEYAQVHAMLKQGKWLQAIQQYRSETGANVDQARAAVENIQMGLPPK